MLRPVATTTARAVWCSPSAVSTVHGPLPESLHDLAEADLDAGDDGVVGQERGHLGAAEDLVEVVQFAEIDQHAAGRELVEAQALQAGARGFGRGGEAGGAGADDDEVVRRVCPWRH